MHTLRSLLLVAAAPAVLSAQTRHIQNAGWLVGCWERTTSANRRAVEKWFPERGGIVLGTSQVLSDAGARETEQLRLFQIGDTLIYEAHPSGQARTPFRAREVSATTLTFENPDHDFPQRIVYTLVAPDSLHARIEGDRAGRRAPVTFRFRRAECHDVALSPSAAARVSLGMLYDDLQRREEQAFAGRLEWLAEHGGTGYRYVTWAAPGSEVGIRDSAALMQVAAALRTNIMRLAPREHRYVVTLERVLVRGDTVEALVSARDEWRFTDDAGRFGTVGAENVRGGTQRWLDEWVRAGDGWQLCATRLLSDEAMSNGRVTVRDGRPVPSP